MSAIKNISLFIPHVFPNFTQKYVTEAFAELGDVDRVDFVAKQDRDGKPYNAVYIHFKKWYNNWFAIKTQGDIERNGSVKFYHDESQYYWIVLPNTAKKHIPGERKPRIDLGEAKSVSVKAIEKTPEMKVKAPALKHLITPKKPTYAQLVVEPVAVPPAKLEADIPRLPSFDECLELLRASIEEWETEEEAQMAEIEAELEAEDENLISIDWRYVQTIEQENMYLHAEVAQLRMALINLDQMYQAEKAKVRAFSNVETSVDL
jgi:hypothetical protein